MSSDDNIRALMAFFKGAADRETIAEWSKRVEAHRLTYHDRQLELELAEHALLKSLGWYFIVAATHRGYDMVWVAPKGHKGSSVFYESRGHAINSVKRWHSNMHPTRNRNNHDD